MPMDFTNAKDCLTKGITILNTAVLGRWEQQNHGSVIQQNFTKNVFVQRLSCPNQSSFEVKIAATNETVTV